MSAIISDAEKFESNGYTGGVDDTGQSYESKISETEEVDLDRIRKNLEDGNWNFNSSGDLTNYVGTSGGELSFTIVDADGNLCTADGNYYIDKDDFISKYSEERYNEYISSHDGQIYSDDINFNEIYTNAADALSGSNAVVAKEEYWGDSTGGKLEYQIRDDGTVLILEGGVPMGFTTKEALFGNNFSSSYDDYYDDSNSNSSSGNLSDAISSVADLVSENVENEIETDYSLENTKNQAEAILQSVNDSGFLDYYDNNSAVAKPLLGPETDTDTDATIENFNWEHMF